MRIWEQFKAWRRKEVMTKGISKGRCFTKKEDIAGANTATAKAKAKLVSIKVIRADGTEEEINHG